MRRPLQLAIAGLGTVGAELVVQLEAKAGWITKRAGRQMRLSAISARRRREHQSAVFVKDVLDLAQLDDVDVVVELIGGAEGIAYDLVHASLEAGKHVVTANKALLAKSGMELARLAEAKGVALNYEAAIAGSVPVVKLLRESLVGTKVHRMSGILNGTSNYILCQMADRGIAFEQALAQAQQLGYAEANPSFDIDGEDAAHKLKLLMSLAFSCVLVDVPAQGIREIEPVDMKLAGDMGYAIRLIAQAHEGCEGSVRPVLLRAHSRLAQSFGTDNVIAIESADQHLVLEGEGAGATPTANSVIADLIDIARGQCLPVFGVPVSELWTAKPSSLDLSGLDPSGLDPSGLDPSGHEQASSFYIRLVAADRAGSMAAITNIMASCDISLSGVVQPPVAQEGKAAPIALVTHKISEDRVHQATSKLQALDAITTKPLALKIEQ